jgi:hypothetical protein
VEGEAQLPGGEALGDAAGRVEVLERPPVSDADLPGPVLPLRDGAAEVRGAERVVLHPHRQPLDGYR